MFSLRPALVAAACAALFSCLLPVRASAAGPGIQPIPDQYVPSGKTLVVPIVATDPGGPARSYTVTVGAPSLTSTLSSHAGIRALIRTGDPHLIFGLSYATATSGSATVTGTMEFQLFPEFAPLASRYIAGFAQGGFYSASTSGSDPYVSFFRVNPPSVSNTLGVIQGGSPTNSNAYPGPFQFNSEYSNALIFSASAGQLAMANSNNTGNPEDGDLNGSQFFVTLNSDRSDLDYGYTLFGQLLRGFDTLSGIAGTPLQSDNSTPITAVDITGVQVVPSNTDAVLILTGTGLCNAEITVTATTAGFAAVTGTFMAHTITDTMNDPPFPQPTADMAAKNGTAKVTLQATDLQRDLIQYGYQRFSPVADASLTSGTSPTVSIPLVSNTDNLVGSRVDQFTSHIDQSGSVVAGSGRGFEGFPFHIAAGDKPLRGTLTPLGPGFNGQLTVPPFTQIATFIAGSAKDTGFAATLNWGNGIVFSGTQLSISPDQAGATVTRYTIRTSGTFAYGAGEYPEVVTVTDAGGANLTLTGTVDVSAGGVALHGADLYKTGGVFRNSPVALVTGSTANIATGLTATINWGDGAVTPGAVQRLTAFKSRVLGTHSYTQPGAYTVNTMLLRSGSAVATSWATAHIAGIKTPSLLPPYPQVHLAQVWSAISSGSASLFTSGSNVGENPVSSVIESNGTFYGTTSDGGSNNDGTIYSVTSSGSATLLYAFTNGTDGAFPFAAPMMGADGNLYGTTRLGGSGSNGTIYELNITGTAGPVLTTLYAFTGGTDGGTPVSALVQAQTTGTGVFYGTASTGGGPGFGTVYQLDTTGTAGPVLTTLYPFTNGTDGAAPYAPLIAGTDGNLYGTTSTSGAVSGSTGSVYQIDLSGSVPVVNVVAAFAADGSQGAHPFSALVAGTDGALYGTTSAGGASGAGTIYSVTLSSSGTAGVSGSISNLYSFTGGSDGANPIAGLVLGTDGAFYGAASAGGASNFGTLFQFTASSATSGSFVALYSFPPNGPGRTPQAALLEGSDNNLYGTTNEGGANGVGTIFRLPLGSSPVTPVTFYNFGSTPNFQVSIGGAVRVINSGNLPAKPASISVYVDTQPVLDGNQILLSGPNGVTAFPVAGLAPGKSVLVPFYLLGAIDDRLKVPAGFDPSNFYVISQITYSDPVADFNGSAKTFVVGHLPSGF